MIEKNSWASALTILMACSNKNITLHCTFFFFFFKALIHINVKGRMVEMEVRWDKMVSNRVCLSNASKLSVMAEQMFEQGC